MAIQQFYQGERDDDEIDVAIGNGAGVRGGGVDMRQRAGADEIPLVTDRLWTQ